MYTIKISLSALLFMAVLSQNAFSEDRVFFDDFETSQGWVRNYSGTDNATVGYWERGNPEETIYGVPMQSGTTVSGVNGLITGPLAGSSVGSYDLDGGITTMRSPDIALPSEATSITLSFSCYFAHYNNSTDEDFLQVKVIGSTTQLVFREVGSDIADQAIWETFSADISSFAGQTVNILIEAADYSDPSLVEAGIDDVLITYDNGIVEKYPCNTCGHNENMRVDGYGKMKEVILEPDDPTGEDIKIDNRWNDGMEKNELEVNAAGGVTIFADEGMGINVAGGTGRIFSHKLESEVLKITQEHGDWINLHTGQSQGQSFWHIHNPVNGDRLEIGYHDDGGNDHWEYLCIKNDGKIGIGKSDPSTKLDVEGSITATSFKVGDWILEAPDYVFHRDYHLRSLEEVKNYIKKEGHLPDVPSASAMKENGVDLSEMSMILLRKLEEMQLYILKQDEELRKQREEIDELKKILK